MSSYIDNNIIFDDILDNPYNPDFCVNDEVIYETLHRAYGKCKVVRITKTQAILDNGERLPIDGVSGCRHLKNYRNKHMVHYQTYYRLPNDIILRRAQEKNYFF